MVHPLEKQLVLGREKSRLGLALVTSNRPARLSGSLPSALALEELAAAQRAGASPSNEVGLKGTKLLTTPAHPPTVMKARRGMGSCRPQTMQEREGAMGSLG